MASIGHIGINDFDSAGTNTSAWQQFLMYGDSGRVVRVTLLVASR